MEVIAYKEQYLTDNVVIDLPLMADFVAYIDRGERTTRSYLTNLAQFSAFLSWAEISQPVRADIIAYRDWLSSEHEAIRLDPVTGWAVRKDSSGHPIKMTCKPNTVAQYLRVVKQFFTWTDASGIYPNVASNVHAPKLKNDTHRKDALSPEEVLQIEKSIITKGNLKLSDAQDLTEGKSNHSEEQTRRLYAMYLLAVNAGLRTVELSRANVKDLECKGDNYWLYVWGKGHTEPDQKKALAPEVAEAILSYLSIREDKPSGSSPLFVATGNRSGGKRISSTTISKMLKGAMKEAGYDSERLTAHSLRHTAGTSVMELTGNLYTAQNYMRHSNPATTEIYIHAKTDRQDADTAKRLYGLYHGQKESARHSLNEILPRMTEEQIERLTRVAESILNG